MSHILTPLLFILSSLLIFKRFPDTREILPDTRENSRIRGSGFPPIRETLPDTRESLPDTRETLPDTRETLPDTQENLPDTQETLPGVREFAPFFKEQRANSKEQRKDGFFSYSLLFGRDPPSLKPKGPTVPRFVKS
jgi:hypothetical protein